MRLNHLTSLGLLLCLASPAAAQNMGMEDVIDPTGATGGAVQTDAAPPSDDWLDRTRRIRQVVKLKTTDGELSAADFKAALAAARASVNPDEMEALRQALEGRVHDGEPFDVTADAREQAVDLIFAANLFDASQEALANGKTYGGSAIPRSVKQVVALAKLNGAVAYDVTETNSDGEGKYSHYPAITPPTVNMAFDYTEVTPQSLLDDMNDTSTHLRMAGSDSVEINGSTYNVGRYTEEVGGTGSISAAYDELLHPVQPFAPSVLAMLGYDLDLDNERVAKVRTRAGNKWSSNCAILSDGTIHCLPAVRRHEDNGGLILTNPSLSRGHQLLWNGHLRVEKGVVTYIGTSGGIAKRAAEGKDRFVDPVALLEAWGFEVKPGLAVVSEHGSARPIVDRERAIMMENPEQIDD